MRLWHISKDKHVWLSGTAWLAVDVVPGEVLVCWHQWSRAVKLADSSVSYETSTGSTLNAGKFCLWSEHIKSDTRAGAWWGLGEVTETLFTYLLAFRYRDFPGGSDGKESACQCRRHRRRGFSHWVGKIPWRRKWQHTPVFLPGESHGQRSLAGCSLWGHKRVRTELLTVSLSTFRSEPRETHQHPLPLASQDCWQKY